MSKWPIWCQEVQDSRSNNDNAVAPLPYLCVGAKADADATRATVMIDLNIALVDVNEESVQWLWMRVCWENMDEYALISLRTCDLWYIGYTYGEKYVISILTN